MFYGIYSTGVKENVNDFFYDSWTTGVECYQAIILM